VCNDTLEPVAIQTAYNPVAFFVEMSMARNYPGCLTRRWVALAGLMLGASIVAGPGALAQAISPSGVQGLQLAPAALSQTDLHDAGVQVPGYPRIESAPDEADQAEAVAAPGPVDPSGVVGAAAASTRAATTNDLIAAGVVSVK
jgi:hypothetical protein